MQVSEPETMVPGVAGLKPIPARRLVELPYGAKAELIDRDRNIWRFANGLCRRMNLPPAPWVPVEGNFTRYFNDLEVIMKADVAAFNVPPSGKVDSDEQNFISLTLMDPRNDAAEIRWVNEVRQSRFEGWQRIEPNDRVALPSTFRLLRQANKTQWGTEIVTNDDASVFLYERGGLLTDWPNPTISGYIFINPQETAWIRMSLAALSRLDVIITSARAAAAQLRVECPAEVAS